MSTSTRLHWLLAAVAVLSCATVAGAQHSQLITDFEVDSLGVSYPYQPGSLADLQVVMFQDPAEADVTETAVLSDSAATFPSDPNDPSILRSSEESFVARFTGNGFFGAHGSDQFLDIRYEWATPSDPNRWVLIETLQSPALGDPSLHLGGSVTFYINIPDCSAYEFPGLTRTPEIGVALLISETGQALPQGFRDSDVSTGSFEFVGVDALLDPNTANPVPVPTNFYPITDPNCAGDTTGSGGHWRPVQIDLTTAGVAGWTYRGGDGTLDATVGDPNAVNRGVLAGLVLAVRNTDTTSEYVEFLIDEITFTAPAAEPAVPPTIIGPVIVDATSILIDDITPSATMVTLEIDRNAGDPNFNVTETVPQAPGLSTTGELRSITIGGLTALDVGDRLRVRQHVGADISDNSLVVTVNPPAAFSATLCLDEDGNSGTADYEWVGAATVVGQNGTQGKPIFPQNGVWQRLEYSLIPGVEPIYPFAGGNGQLEPDGGLYKLDSMFFTIDSSEPSAGPYNIFVDHIYYIDPNGVEVVIGDSEFVNPFPYQRGQSTTGENWDTIISGLASYDGARANRLLWEFPDTALSNTHAVYRPAATFSDASLAVGMFLLVEDPRDPNLPTPTVETYIIGSQTAINVSFDPNAAPTDVSLLVNGVTVNTVDPNGAAAVDIDPQTALSIGDSISALMTTGAGQSNYAYARAVQRAPAPTVQNPLGVGQTEVVVNDILNTGNTVASLVTLYSGDTELDSLDPNGQASVTFTLGDPGLLLDEQISATQTVNGSQSERSNVVTVQILLPLCLEAIVDDFEVDSSADYTVVKQANSADPNDIDSTATFGFDYVAAGIPLAPRSVMGDTGGLRMTCNDVAGVSNAITAFHNLELTGLDDYRLLVDVYMGVTGTGGTTEHMHVGVAGDGSTVNSLFYPITGSGHFMAMTGEGGSSSDYRHSLPSGITNSGDPSYLNSTNTTNATGDTYQALFPSPPYDYAGSPGNAWTTLQIDMIGGVGGTITYSLDGATGMTPIIQDTSELLDGFISLGYGDLFSSLADPFQSQFIIYDNLVVYKAHGTITLFDWNQDTFIDTADAEAMYSCLGGVGDDMAGQECGAPCLGVFDENLDSDVDLGDVAEFQKSF